MNISQQLEENIANSLNIKKISSENEDAWIKRIIYSLIARNAYASLWDIQEIDSSITHFKNRAKELFQTLKTIYPRYLEIIDEQSMKDLIDYIYNLYLETGQFYHTPNRIMYSKKLVSQYNDISLVRSPRPSDKVFMSGLGFYIKDQTKSSILLQDMFNISLKKMSELYVFLKDREFKKAENFESIVNYLRLEGSFSKGYWKHYPDNDGRLSLMKIGYTGNEIYYLYKYENDNLMIYQLPNWMVEHKKYLDIACSLLHQYHTLPPIQYIEDDELVSVQLSYLLPPKLQLFYELYSWPRSYINNSPFVRMMNKQVFKMFKTLLESLEFEFKKGM